MEMAGADRHQLGTAGGVDRRQVEVSRGVLGSACIGQILKGLAGVGAHGQVSEVVRGRQQLTIAAQSLLLLNVNLSIMSWRAMQSQN